MSMEIYRRIPDYPNYAVSTWGRVINIETGYVMYQEEQQKVEEKELEIFKEDMSYYYTEGINEIRRMQGKKEHPPLFCIIPDSIFLYLIERSNAIGYSWQQYIEATIRNNANQLYRQVNYTLGQQNDLKIDSDEFEEVFNQQLKQKVSINEDKISGSADMELVGLNNFAKVEGYKNVLGKQDDFQVMFLAVGDEKTTQMCQSLDKQIFNVYGENEFERYYGERNNELTKVKIRCRGLVAGLNLPPISHHFHWCRSTVMYVANDGNMNYNDINNPSYIRLNVDNGYKPESVIDKIVNAVVRMPEKIRELLEKTKFEIFSKGNITRNGKEIDSSFYDRNEDKVYIITGKDLTEEEVIHEIGHAIETKLKIYEDSKYINIRNKGLSNYYERDLHELEGYKGTEGIWNEKFISILQGKIYAQDLNGKYHIDVSKKINMDCLGDYFSEGFRQYFENPTKLIVKDIELYKYIKRLVE